MKRKAILISTTIMTLLLSGCVTPTESLAVVKAESVALVKPTKTETLNLHEQGVLLMRKQIVKQALAGLGVPYVFSGISRHGWDCSGFTEYVFGEFGIQLEHSATKQAHSAKPTHKPQAGDLVAFSRGGYWYYHVGIYLGNGKVINANSYYGRTLIEPITNYKGDKITFINVIK